MGVATSKEITTNGNNRSYGDTIKIHVCSTQNQGTDSHHVRLCKLTIQFIKIMGTATCSKLGCPARYIQIS